MPVHGQSEMVKNCRLLALIVFDCSRGRCPKYFSDVYIPVHTVAARSRLRSADHVDLVVPRVLSRFGCCSFCVSGPRNETARAGRRGQRGRLILDSEKQSSLKARLRNGLTYLLTYLLTYCYISVCSHQTLTHCQMMRLILTPVDLIGRLKRKR